MFSVMHLGLLGGIALVGVPILIHLLLRQRPRPRPWAAMRWLLAAAKAAQRRWRLTNLLLLLARCAVIALAALALARPSLSGIGHGHRLVLVIDRTASMGVRGADPGPLAAAKAALAHASLPYQSVVVATVDARVEVVADGPPQAALSAISAIEPAPLPGGLDDANRPELAARLAALCDRSSDVLLVSDFAQDSGDGIQALLAPLSHQVLRWRVGSPADNASITGVEGLGDQLPDVGGELAVTIAGSSASISLAVDDAPAVQVGSAPASPNGTTVRVPLPPLSEGAHRLHLSIEDHALAYDNQLDLPVVIRPRIEAMAVQEATDYVAAALHADDQRSFLFHAVNPAQFANEPLPARGVLLLRARVSDPGRIGEWVAGGGVVWAGLGALLQDASLRPLVQGLSLTGASRPGGAYACGSPDIDESLGLATRTGVPAVALPEGAEVLLRAGADPVVVAIPHGHGWVVAEIADIASDKVLEARATTPLWVVRTARTLASRLDAPRVWYAGAKAPEAATLRRSGDVEQVAAGDRLLLAPGTWDSERGPVVVMPAREEGKIDRIGAPGTPVALEKALPRAAGADLGPMVALAMLAMCVFEGAFAAWAGKTYGR